MQSVGTPNGWGTKKRGRPRGPSDLTLARSEAVSIARAAGTPDGIILAVLARDAAALHVTVGRNRRIREQLDRWQRATRLEARRRDATGPSGSGPPPACPAAQARRAAYRRELGTYVRMLGGQWVAVSRSAGWNGLQLPAGELEALIEQLRHQRAAVEFAHANSRGDRLMLFPMPVDVPAYLELIDLKISALQSLLAQQLAAS